MRVESQVMLFLMTLIFDSSPVLPTRKVMITLAFTPYVVANSGTLMFSSMNVKQALSPPGKDADCSTEAKTFISGSVFFSED
jgi:hypothetical protein